MALTARDFGIISMTDRQSRDELATYVEQIEDMGYDSIWLPELFGREPFSTAGWLLGRTRRLGIATGIANVYARDATAAAQSAQTLAEPLRRSRTGTRHGAEGTGGLHGTAGLPARLGALRARRRRC